jgi:hypothetical protein
MSTLSIETLELRALEQRNHLHDQAAELKTKIDATRQKLDIANHTRQHFFRTAAVVAAVGLLSGYAVGGAFTAR